MHIFISTGEVSGDLQGGLLVEALFRKANELGIDLKITALGGDRMAAAGAKLLSNTTKIGSIGLVEAIPFILPTLKSQWRAKQFIKKNTPDIVVLIDYVGPNTGIGDFIRQQRLNIPIFYYIAPQAWVWSFDNRNTRTVARISDRILAIFPEEARYFTEFGVDVKWVGHPLVHRMAQQPDKFQCRQKLGLDPDQTIVTLLPASRSQELKYLLPVIIAAAKKIQQKLPDVKFLIPAALPQYRATLEKAVNASGLNAILLDQREQNLLAIAAADLAITKSGTTNLEIALLNVPQVVLYKVHPLTMWIARHILKFSIPFMSAVNLVLMREIVPELMQEQATVERITSESIDLLLNGDRRQRTFEDYQEMRTALGEGNACDRAALDILQYSLQVSHALS